MDGMTPDLDSWFRAETERRKRQRAATKAERRAAKLTSIERRAGTASPDLPLGRRFAVITADPPWKFAVRSELGLDRSADNHYPTLATEDILALPVADMAAKDCVLFLWVTRPFLAIGFDVLKAWGFEYKSNYVWAKDRMGTGYWGRDLHEHILIATRGAMPSPLPSDVPPSVFEAMLDTIPSLHRAPVGAHSVKPDFLPDMLDRFYPGIAKLELFARGAAPRPGWTFWGNEA